MCRLQDNFLISRETDVRSSDMFINTFICVFFYMWKICTHLRHPLWFWCANDVIYSGQRFTTILFTFKKSKKPIAWSLPRGCTLSSPLLSHLCVAFVTSCLCPPSSLFPRLNYFLPPPSHRLHPPSSLIPPTYSLLSTFSSLWLPPSNLLPSPLSFLLPPYSLQPSLSSLLPLPFSLLPIPSSSHPKFLPSPYSSLNSSSSVVLPPASSRLTSSSSSLNSSSSSHPHSCLLTYRGRFCFVFCHSQHLLFVVCMKACVVFVVRPFAEKSLVCTWHIAMCTLVASPQKGARQIQHMQTD